jgi:hypothetical protein
MSHGHRLARRSHAWRFARSKMCHHGRHCQPITMLKNFADPREELFAVGHGDTEGKACGGVPGCRRAQSGTCISPRTKAS